MPKSLKVQRDDLRKQVFELRADIDQLRQQKKHDDHLLWEAKDRLREMNRLCDTQRGAVLVLKAAIALLRLSSKGRKLAMDHAEGRTPAFLVRDGNGFDPGSSQYVTAEADEHEHADEHGAE